MLPRLRLRRARKKKQLPSFSKSLLFEMCICCRRGWKPGLCTTVHEVWISFCHCDSGHMISTSYTNRTHKHIHEHIHKHIHKQNTQTHTRTHTQTHTYIHKHIHNTHTHTQLCIISHLHPSSSHLHAVP